MARIQRWLKLLNTNLPQKLLAFLVAVILWVLATSPTDQIQKIQFSIPIAYTNLPSDLALISSSTQFTNIVAQVGLGDSNNISPQDFQVRANLQEAQNGEWNYQIQTSDIYNPKRIKILNITPNNIQFVFEESEVKEIKIEPILNGKLTTGYVLQNVSVEPQTVKLQGPKSVLAKLKQVRTLPIVIDNLRDNTELAASLELPKNLSVVGDIETLYQVHIKVGSLSGSLVFEDIPLSLIGQEFETRINPKVFNVAVQGPKDVLNNLRRQEIQAFIDLTELGPGEHRIQFPTVVVPNAVEVRTTWPTIDVWVLTQKIHDQP